MFHCNRREFLRAALAGSCVPVAAVPGVPDGSKKSPSGVARPMPRPEGAPAASDVCMRLFRRRQGGAEIEAGKQFHISYAAWSYIMDRDYIRRVHDLGWRFQGTMNAVTHNTEFALKDKEGEPVLDHFNKPGRYWADSHNEAYRKWFADRMAKWGRLGADAIQRDEPTAIRHWSIQEAVDFIKDVHARAWKNLGRRLPTSVNLAWNNSGFGGRGEPVAELFDFGMAELGKRHVKPEFLWKAARQARSRKKTLVYTSYHDLGVRLYRLAIAACYATGSNFIVPWDQYAGVGNDRVFSRPEDLADLYGFVRACAPYLDGYEDALAVGPGLKDNRWTGSTPVRVLRSSGDLCVFARAKAGQRDAPVVLHLVDFAENAKKVELGLWTETFFGGRPLQARILTPVAYNAKMHERAEKEGSYSALRADADVKTEARGAWTKLSLPAMEPWGILVLNPRA